MESVARCTGSDASDAANATDAATDVADATNATDAATTKTIEE